MTRSAALLLALLGALPALATAQAPPSAPDARPRIRDLGVEPGVLPPGPLDAITDVAGVRVGHETVVEGDSVRTGVTAILAHGGNLFQEKVPAAVYVGNGFGKAAGFLQVQELGTLETPIVLTNTLAVGTAVQAVAAWTLEQPGNGAARSVNAVVGETNDGGLNDIRSFPVTADDVRRAIAAARGGPVAEGSVGAGTGTQALGWKGGIGTASRRLPAALGGWTVGALVQSNFGGLLAIDGVPVGELLGRHAYREVLEAEPVSPDGAADGAAAAAMAGAAEAPGGGAAADGAPANATEAVPAAAPDDGSCMIVLATDAPLSARNLERLAKRAVLALGRVGSFMSNGSGDFVIAFSTARENRRPHEAEDDVLTVRDLRNDETSPLFLAAVEAVEEAIYNSLLRAETVTGHEGRTAEAIPVERLRELLVRHGRVAER
ncbi:MAG TPA: P1 family peptidase [Thermoanaerobaculia bacterium]|nr:P1 family peptidase [Thermoanaerobaculia bacterium]